MISERHLHCSSGHPIATSYMLVFLDSCYNAIQEHILLVLLQYFDDLPFLRTSPQMKCSPITSSLFHLLQSDEDNSASLLGFTCPPKK